MGTGNLFVYILSSRIGGTLYIGVTNNLIRRVAEHKSKTAEGFTKKHGVDRLVYFECFDDIENAIRREKRLKNGLVLGKSSSLRQIIPIGQISIQVLLVRNRTARLIWHLDYWVVRVRGR